MKRFSDLTEPELRAHFNKLAITIEDELPLGPSKRGRALFTLVVWDADQIAQYVSNAKRADIIKAMREMADILEQQGDVPR